MFDFASLFLNINIQTKTLSGLNIFNHKRNVLNGIRRNIINDWIFETGMDLYILLFYLTIYECN